MALDIQKIVAELKENLNRAIAGSKTQPQQKAGHKMLPPFPRVTLPWH